MRPFWWTVVAVSVTDPHGPYGSVIVVGGGCYGSYYVRQLERALAAGAIEFESVVVVDRDQQCAVSQIDAPRTSLVVAEWDRFFDDYLSSAGSDSRDAIVPSPLMPHLMYQWLLERARRRWPGRDIRTVALATDPDTPWQSSAPDGTRYVSYATWQCPINCVEPRLCPHTRALRDWSMPDAAARLVARTLESPSAVEAAPGAGRLAGPVIFHCTHRAFGVGMFDTRDVVAADEFVRNTAAHAATDLLVGTVSHCHGALNVLHVGA